MVRYGAQAAEANDIDRLVRLLRLTTVVECIGGVAAVAVAAAFAPLVGPRLGWSPEIVALAIPYSFAVLATIRSTPAGYLQLSGRFDLLGIHNVVAPAVRLVGALIALAVGSGLRGFSYRVANCRAGRMDFDVVAWPMAGAQEIEACPPDWIAARCG